MQVWFPQRTHAIARGEADAARLIFSNISRQRLDRQERKALDVIRAELRQLVGQREEGAARARTGRLVGSERGHRAPVDAARRAAGGARATPIARSKAMAMGYRLPPACWASWRRCACGAACCSSIAAITEPAGRRSTAPSSSWE